MQSKNKIVFTEFGTEYNHLLQHASCDMDYKVAYKYQMKQDSLMTESIPSFICPCVTLPPVCLCMFPSVNANNAHSWLTAVQNYLLLPSVNCTGWWLTIHLWFCTYFCAYVGGSLSRYNTVNSLLCPLASLGAFLCMSFHPNRGKWNRQQRTLTSQIQYIIIYVSMNTTKQGGTDFAFHHLPISYRLISFSCNTIRRMLARHQSITNDIAFFHQYFIWTLI